MSEEIPRTHTVSKEHHRLRVDRYLAEVEPKLSRGQVRTLIAQEKVLINDIPVPIVDHFVKRGDQIEILPIVDAGIRDLAEGDLLYSDRSIIAVAKPPGLPSIPTPLDEPNAQKSAERLFCDGKYLYVVHRLDRETSGVILFARDQRTMKALEVLFTHRRMTKLYHALVIGKPDAKGSVTEPLRTTPNSHTGRIEVDTKKGQKARTDYRLREERGEQSLLELKPITGRRHQIRAHLAAIGHPIVGDTRYGGPPADRLFLHALSIAFPHPGDGRRKRILAPLPPELEVTKKSE